MFHARGLQVALHQGLTCLVLIYSFLKIPLDAMLERYLAIDSNGGLLMKVQ